MAVTTYSPTSGAYAPQGLPYNMAGSFGAGGTSNPYSGGYNYASQFGGSGQGSSGGSGITSAGKAPTSSDWTPYYATPAIQGNQNTAQNLTGMSTEQSPYLSAIFGQIPSAPDIMGTKSSIDTSNLGANSYMTGALDKMQNLGQNDFGIPQDIRQKMEVAAAQKVNPQYQVQKQAAQRMAQRMGLSNDAGGNKAVANIEQSRLADVTGAQNDIETQSALQANQQKLQNYKDLISGGAQVAGANANAAQLGENSRQFNVGAGLDESRFGASLAEAEDRMRLNRSSMNQSVAEWLADYEMRRQRLGAGLADSASTAANQQSQQFLQSLYQPMDYGKGTGNYFGSGA